MTQNNREEKCDCITTGHHPYCPYNERFTPPTEQAGGWEEEIIKAIIEAQEYFFHLLPDAKREVTGAFVHLEAVTKLNIHRIVAEAEMRGYEKGIKHDGT